MAWGGHENWAADRGCHAATCSWKEIPRKRGFIHGRSSPNPPTAQVTKPAPRRIGRTQAHKLLLRGFGDHHRKSCHLHLRLISTRHPVIIAGPVITPPETYLTRTARASHQICHRSSIPHERIGHPRRGRKLEFKEGRYPPLDVPACSLISFSMSHAEMRLPSRREKYHPSSLIEKYAKRNGNGSIARH
jgi:hypothetical protein